MYRNLRAELARKGMTIKELSQKTDIPYSTLSPKLRGFGKIPVDMAVKIKKAMGINLPLEVLFDERTEL